MASGIEFLGERITNALYDALMTMTGFSVEEAEQREEPFHMSIAGAMLLSGKKNLLLILSVNQKTAELLISYMTGIDHRDLLPEEMQDGITEFANMVAGSAKEALLNTEYEYNLSVPFTIIGENICVLTKNKTEKFSRLFKNEEINIKLQIFSF